jgi:DNA processing protein
LEYHVRAERFHFPERNQWVAGMCDALLVVETGKDGGSMLTVANAVKYGKKIFAVPGRITDHRSAGCNWLIRQGTAQMVSSGQELTAAMGWEWPAGGVGAQARLEFEHAGRPCTEDQLLQLLREKESPAIDELVACSHLDASAVALSLLNLELRGSVRSLPGKRYMLAACG